MIRPGAFAAGLGVRTHPYVRRGVDERLLLSRLGVIYLQEKVVCVQQAGFAPAPRPCGGHQEAASGFTGTPASCRANPHGAYSLGLEGAPRERCASSHSVQVRAGLWSGQCLNTLARCMSRRTDCCCSCLHQHVSLVVTWSSIYECHTRVLVVWRPREAWICTPANACARDAAHCMDGLRSSPRTVHWQIARLLVEPEGPYLGT